MNKSLFLFSKEVLLIVLLGFIAVWMVACGRTGIDVYVENQTQSNFHINGINGERVVKGEKCDEGSEGCNFFLFLVEKDPTGSFWICRDSGCEARITAVGIDFPERTEKHDNLEDVINKDWVVIEEPGAWNQFTAYSKNGYVSVNVSN